MAPVRFTETWPGNSSWTCPVTTRFEPMRRPESAEMIGAAGISRPSKRSRESLARGHAADRNVRRERVRKPIITYLGIRGGRARPGLAGMSSERFATTHDIGVEI